MGLLPDSLQVVVFFVAPVEGEIGKMVIEIIKLEILAIHDVLIQHILCARVTICFVCERIRGNDLNLSIAQASKMLSLQASGVVGKNLTERNLIT